MSYDNLTKKPDVISAPLTVTSVAVFKNDVSIAGTTYAIGNVNISGTAVLSSTLSVGGNIIGNVSITGADIVASNNLTVSNETTLNGILSVSDNTYLEDLSVSGNATITGVINITNLSAGTGHFSSSVGMATTLSVGGNVTHDGTLIVGGNVTHSESTTLTGATAVNADMTFANAADLITGTGSVAFGNGPVTLSGTLNVAGLTTLDAVNTGVISATTITAGDIIVSATGIAGNKVSLKDMVIGSDGVIEFNVTAAGLDENLSVVNAALTFNSADANALGNLSVTTDLSVGGSVFVDIGVSVAGSTTLTGAVIGGSTLSVGGLTTLNAVSATTGDFDSTVTMATTLSVAGATTLKSVSATTGNFDSTVTMATTLSVAGATTIANLSATEFYTGAGLLRQMFVCSTTDSAIGHLPISTGLVYNGSVLTTSNFANGTVNFIPMEIKCDESANGVVQYYYSVEGSDYSVNLVANNSTNIVYARFLGIVDGYISNEITYPTTI
jgi:hypothetical protein